MLFRAISYPVLFEKRGDRVEAEAAALAAARLPGVVELVDGSDGVLRTRLVKDARSLAEMGPLTHDEVAGILASVATTLADLHDRGVAHGGLDAEHVLVRSDGQPVLCSLGRDGDPAGDVAALGRLIDRLLAVSRQGGPAPSGASRPRWVALPSRRTSRSFPTSARPRSRGGLRAHPRLGPMLAPTAAVVLAGLVTEATAQEPGARPTARALASAVHQGVPTARLPVPPQPTLLAHPPPRPAGLRRVWTQAVRRVPDGAGVAVPRRRWPLAAGRAAGPVSSAGRGGIRLAGLLAAVAAGNLVLIAAVVVMANALVDRGTGSPPAGVPAPVGRDGATATGAAEDRGGTGRPPTTVTTTSAPVAVRVWPPEPLDLHDGVLTFGGSRYAVGLRGDAVVAGDWACTGQRTLALLRPATGEVFAFDEWAGEGEEKAARPLGKVEGATALRAADVDGDGCDDLEVARPNGPPVHLEVAG